MAHTWLLIKELAYITATAAAWAFIISIPLTHNYITRKPITMKPMTTEKVFATITYLRGGYRMTDTGWFSCHGTRIIKRTYRGGEDSRTACYTDELLNWQPVTRK